MNSKKHPGFCKNPGFLYRIRPGICRNSSWNSEFTGNFYRFQVKPLRLETALTTNGLNNFRAGGAKVRRANAKVQAGGGRKSNRKCETGWECSGQVGGRGPFLVAGGYLCVHAHTLRVAVASPHGVFRGSEGELFSPSGPFTALPPSLEGE